MSEGPDADLCDFCKHGKVFMSEEEIAFHQFTSRGYVSCTVMVPMGVCGQCGAKSLGEAAEALIEEAVQRELDKFR